MSKVIHEIPREEGRYRIRGELAICVIAINNSFAVYLMLYSLGGMPSISSVPFILSEVFPIASLGAWTYVFQTVLIMTLIVLRLRKKERQYIIFYLCSFLVGGVFSFMMDLHALWINRLPQTIFFCIIYFIVSFFSLAIGIAVSNHCKMPIVPTDLFPRELTLILDKPYKKVKTSFDIICLCITILLGLLVLHDIRGIGIGTVLCAFIIGRLIAAIGNWLNNRFIFVSCMDPERAKAMKQSI